MYKDQLFLLDAVLKGASKDLKAVLLAWSQHLVKADGSNDLRVSKVT